MNTPVPRPFVAINSQNAARILALTRLGIGLLNDIAWSPDGKQAALATSTGLYLMDWADQQNLLYIKTNSVVVSTAFSPNGTLVASGESDGLVRLWDPVTGAEVAELSGHLFKPVRQVVFSADGTRLASVSDDKTVRVWDVAQGVMVSPVLERTQGFTGAVFSPDGSILATVSLDSYLILWSTTDFTQVRSMAHNAPVYAVAYAPDGKTILTGGGEAGVQRWDAASGSRLSALGRRTSTIVDVEISTSGALVAFADAAGQLQVWNMDGELLMSGKNERLDRQPSSSAFDYTHRISLSPDGTALVSGIGDVTLRVWQTTTGEERAVIRDFSDFVTAVRFSPNSAYLAAQTSSGLVKVWDFRQARLLYEFSGALPLGRVFSSDNQMLVLRTDAASITVYDLRSGKELYHFTGHRDVKAASFRGDGIFLAAGGMHDLHVWSLRSRQEILTRAAYSLNTCSGASDNNGQTLAFVTPFHYIDFVNRNSQKLCEAVYSSEKALDYQPDGTLFAIASEGTLKVWDYTRSNIGRTEIKFPLGLVIERIALSPDGKLVAVALNDLSIRLWDLASQTELSKDMRHAAAVQALQFSPQGDYLVSSALDGTVVIWGVK
jgi:WD40 repeat protein